MSVISKGGLRPGAGRPETKEKRVNVTARVKPETRAILDDLRRDGFLLGQHIDREIERFSSGEKYYIQTNKHTTTMKYKNNFQVLPTQNLFLFDDVGKLTVEKVVGFVVTQDNEEEDFFECHPITESGVVYPPFGEEDSGVVLGKLNKNSALYKRFNEKCQEGYGRTIEELCRVVGCPIDDIPLEK